MSETVRPAADQAGPAGRPTAQEAADARARAEDRDPPATAVHWVRRVTPLGIGRRRVRLEVAGGTVALVRTYRRGRERDVVRAPGHEFHSVVPSRGGQGLHLWHGARLYRLRGRPEKIYWGDLGDPLLVVMFPVALVVGALDRAQERKAAVRLLLGLLAPVVGAPPPGVTVRSPLPGLPTAVLRVLVRIALVVAVLAALVLAALHVGDRLGVS